MSEVLSAAAQKLGVPEAVVRRSAEARAKSTGTAVDEVLAAWAGGGTVVASAPVTAAPVAAATPVATEPVGAPVAESPPVAVMTAPAPVTAKVEERQITPAGLVERVGLAWKIGVWAGLGVSLLVSMLSLQWVLPGASLVGEAGAYRVALDLSPDLSILGSGLLGLAGGLVLAAFTRGAVALRSEGHALSNRWVSSVAAGGLVGLVMGLLVGAAVTGAGETVEGVEGVIKVPALGAIISMVVGWMLLGGLAGVVVQFLGTPVGIGAEAQAAAETVRRRLGAAFGLPVKVALTILLIVLPVAYAFIQFPRHAPLTGSFVAASILGFAALASTRPNLKISRNEFGVAVIGVITVVVLIVSVLAEQGGGHGEEPSPAPAAEAGS